MPAPSLPTCRRAKCESGLNAMASTPSSVVRTVGTVTGRRLPTRTAPPITAQARRAPSGLKAAARTYPPESRDATLWTGITLHSSSRSGLDWLPCKWRAS